MFQITLSEMDSKVFVQYSDSFGETSKDIDITSKLSDSLSEILDYIKDLKSPQEIIFQCFQDSATDEEKIELTDSFPFYQVGRKYSVNDEFQHGGDLYRVIQAHVSQNDWEPSLVPALYLRINKPGEIPEFVQPTGAHDAYNVGDVVSFEGSVYESTINGNVWSPTANPAGWQLIPV